MLRWAGDSGGRGQSAPSRPSGPSRGRGAREGERELLIGGAWWLAACWSNWTMMTRSIGVLSEVISSVHFAGAGFRERVWKGVDAFTLPRCG
jgi:hypothetical protein